MSPHLAWDTKKLREIGIATFNRNAPKGRKISLQSMADMLRFGYGAVFASVTHSALNYTQMLECFEGFGGKSAFSIGMSNALLDSRAKTVSFVLRFLIFLNKLVTLYNNFLQLPRGGSFQHLAGSTLQISRQFYGLVPTH